MIHNVSIFIEEVNQFHDEYIREGPAVSDIDFYEGKLRVTIFNERYEMYLTKLHIYHTGESFLGLPHREYP